MIDFTSKDRYSFEDLVRLVALLRAPGGCPWDGAQTHRSIRRNFLEEAYEACEGIDRDDPDILCEELGDVLLQVLFHIDIEREAGRFTLEDVCTGVCRKLVFRHPALFGGEDGLSWEELKQREKGQKSTAETLDGVARSLPALIRAEKLWSKAAKCGLSEASNGTEMGKLKQNVNAYATAGSREEAETALGNLLFAAAAAAAEAGIDPESALHAGCERFICRVRAAERTTVSRASERSNATSAGTDIPPK